MNNPQFRPKTTNTPSYLKGKAIVPRNVTTLKKQTKPQTPTIVKQKPPQTNVPSEPEHINEGSSESFTKSAESFNKSGEAFLKLSQLSKLEKSSNYWTIVENKREEEEDVSFEIPFISKTLDRHTFYQNGFSLFSSSFRESSKEESHSRLSVIEDSHDRRNFPLMSSIHNSSRTEEYVKDEAPKKETLKSNSYKKKISQIAIPQGKNITKGKWNVSQEVKSDRGEKARMVESMWLSENFGDKLLQGQKGDFSHSAVFAPQKIPFLGIKNPEYRKTNSFKHSEDSSPASKDSGYKSPKNPMVEPNSDDYGKFNKLFKNVENRTTKKLDPNRYQKVINRSDINPNFVQSPSKKLYKMNSSELDMRDNNKYFFGAKTSGDFFYKKDSSKEYGRFGKNNSYVNDQKKR